MLPAQVRVPATPAVQAVDIRALYNVDNAKLLGKGGFSEVIVARHIASGEVRALKVMKKETLTGKKAEMVTHEKEILRRTNHPCIITLYETIQTPTHVFMSLDLMSEDLFEFIVRNKFINETLTRKIMFQVLSGVAYLHQQSVTHRDIKPENILINTFLNGAAADASVENINSVDPSEVEFDVRLADFGLSKLVLEYDVRNTPCGTSYYLAPEIIRGIEEQGARPLCTNSHLVKSIDVWSCGIVFYILLCGRPPFSSRTIRTSEERRDMLSRMDRGVLFPSNIGWDKVSNDAKDLICLMLDLDMSKRISAMDALKHPFFTANGFTRPIESPTIQLHSSSDHRSTKMKEKKGVLQSIKSMFSATKTPEHQQLHDDIDSLQSDQVKADDKDGDESTYVSNMEVKPGKAAKPAVMNPKFKVGPGALKK